MKAISLKRAIERRGGKAEIIVSETRGFEGKIYLGYNLDGTLNGHDIHMILNSDKEGSFFTSRLIKNRGQYDPGSDYNSGGYTFYRKIKWLDELVAVTK